MPYRIVYIPQQLYYRTLWLTSACASKCKCMVSKYPPDRGYRRWCCSHGADGGNPSRTDFKLGSDGDQGCTFQHLDNGATRVQVSKFSWSKWQVPYDSSVLWLTVRAVQIIYQGKTPYAVTPITSFCLIGTSCILPSIGQICSNLWTCQWTSQPCKDFLNRCFEDWLA